MPILLVLLALSLSGGGAAGGYEFHRWHRNRSQNGDQEEEGIVVPNGLALAEEKAASMQHHFRPLPSPPLSSSPRLSLPLSHKFAGAMCASIRLAYNNIFRITEKQIPLLYALIK
jgi:hypothetical protein